MIFILKRALSNTHSESPGSKNYQETGKTRQIGHNSYF